MLTMPHEIAIGDLYFPPLLLVVIFSYLVSTGIIFIAGKLGLLRYVAVPVLVELSLVVLISGLISQFIHFV
ncbi:DUF1656 domain-containing protein [Shewanella gaetbuli]|uniref:DUF1656 domain-containing protein n=1 Tax=Shewanella gaetbuli TaxID=220752 RepID=A0A9X1ZMW5_9GAMM|nr:DUF1656 domain-containing protein [Shewanella gaetbuli]MCL1142830.1 DUF1656 domain-containing protein [Shewanella gaetbuli]